MVTSKALNLFDNFNQLTPYAVGYDRVFDQLQKYVLIMYRAQGFHHTTSKKGVTTTIQLNSLLLVLVMKIIRLK